MMSLGRVMRQAGDLSAFPATASKLAAVVAAEDTEVNDVVEVIEYDQAVTADVLRYANSAVSAASRRIVSVREAVIRLGGARILSRIVVRHVKGRMRTALPVYGYAENDLWRHSVAAAVAAENVSRERPDGADGLSFTAALLHDIGKLLLGRGGQTEAMNDIWDLVYGGAGVCTCEQAERNVLGYSHADVGAEVAAAWRLPEPIIRAIRDHHGAGAGMEATDDNVRVANFVARAIGAGIGHEGMAMALDSTIAQRTGISRQTLEKLCAATATGLDDVLGMYDLS